MTQLTASVAIGTAATLLATILLLLRVNVQGRRPVVALTRRWIATSTPTSSLVLTLLAAIAVIGFASCPALEARAPSGGSALNHVASVTTEQVANSQMDDTGDAPAWDALRAYADKIDSKSQSMAPRNQASETAQLPDVDSMIGKLVARLEKSPEDVNGWKMLGWSYLNTDKPDEAVHAYETALKLAPGDNEIQKALEVAKSAQTAPAKAP